MYKTFEDKRLLELTNTVAEELGLEFATIQTYEKCDRLTMHELKWSLFYSHEG